MSKKENAIPQGAFARATRLFASGARVAVREVAAQISGKTGVDTRIKQAQDIVQTLGQLKGAAMKAGQLLSIEAADFLDPEVVAVLRQLQDQVSFMPYAQARMILQKQLGMEKFARLSDLSPEPIAAASIGQVHSAKLDGEMVAIKIQYPGVAKSIDSDLASLKSLVLSTAKMMGKKMDIEPVIDEINRSLKREVNYLIEADNADLTRQHIKDEVYIIPRVYRDFSTETVLTQSFEQGLRIADWIKSQPSRDDVQAFSKLVIELLITEMLITGVVQTDPNYANFLYRPAQRHLVLLDFGATMTYSVEFRQQLQGLIRGFVHGSTDEFMQALIAHGLFAANESDETKDLLRQIIVAIKQVYDKQQPVNLRDDVPHHQIRTTATSMGIAIKHTPPPKDLVLIGRKFGGMVNLLRELNAQIDVPHLAQRIVGTSIA